ncbi:MAG: hypothetical protein IH624_11985 [Phycisphaerae bacterium]|nr:hypothetical protein [Phycisphaerae bacterium]
MKTRFAKYALGGMILTGVFLGFAVFLGRGRVSWAEVAERVARVEAVSFRVNEKTQNAPGFRKGLVLESEGRALLLDGCGMKVDRYVGDELTGMMYVDFDKQEIVHLMPNQKQYTVVTLTNALYSETRRKLLDPKEFVSQFLAREYTQLGRSRINGVAVEGVESHEPLLGQRAGRVISRLWVDVKTGWPVQMTMLVKDGEGMEMEKVFGDFQWGLEVDRGAFGVVIPEDYELIVSVNTGDPERGKDMVSGLRLFGEASGGRYPSDLSSDTISNEWAKLIVSSVGIDQRVEIDMAKMMEMVKLGMAGELILRQDRDAAYYGASVTAADADRVLLRWRRDDGSYNVMFGDLRVEQRSAERLAELEGR